MKGWQRIAGDIWESIAYVLALPTIRKIFRDRPLLLEIYPPRGLNLDPRVSERTSNSLAHPLLSSREVFQPLSASELLAAGNATVCRRVQGVYRARTALLGERASAVVALIDRLNARLHTLTAENRETRAHFSLSQSARHNTPYLVARLVIAVAVIKRLEPPQWK
ncbi:hypothetical protein TSMEX_004169 [Taenia solium]|eukprot:TsM_000634400 transcript=TsM_000634400 gene=TsM_000634400